MHILGAPWQSGRSGSVLNKFTRSCYYEFLPGLGATHPTNIPVVHRASWSKKSWPEPVNLLLYAHLCPSWFMTMPCLQCLPDQKKTSKSGLWRCQVSAAGNGRRPMFLATSGPWKATPSSGWCSFKICGKSWNIWKHSHSWSLKLRRWTHWAPLTYEMKGSKWRRNSLYLCPEESAHLRDAIKILVSGDVPWKLKKAFAQGWMYLLSGNPDDGGMILWIHPHRHSGGARAHCWHHTIASGIPHLAARTNAHCQMN